jgi:hypothetical protein
MLSRPAGSIRWAACLALPALLVGASAPMRLLPAVSPPHAATSNQAHGSSLGEAFGFQLGEERRYTLGPDRALQPGETVLWTMRLESLDGEPSDFRATFILEHDSLRFARNGNILDPDERTGDRTRIRLVVNQHGFPLQVHFDRNREGSEVSYSHEEVRLTFEEEKYVVKNDLAMGIREFNIRVPDSDVADAAVPRGVYLSPSLNPGLLTIIYRTLFEPGMEKVEFLELRPAQLARRGASSRNPLDRSRSEPGRRGNLNREEYRIGDFLTIDVGTRRLDAIELKDPRFDGHSYVDTDGRVLKVDTRVRDRDAWMRMLHAWEY